MINQNNLQGLANSFLKSKKNKDESYRADFVYSKYNNTLKTIFNRTDDKLFEKIILADKREMEIYIALYKNYLKSHGYKFQSIKKLQEENKNIFFFEELLSLYNAYDNFSQKWNNKIVDAVDTRTCLYCNREYVINYTDKTETKTTAELDHYYPRSLYPFLSISFLNLIPSCKTCNSNLKKSEDTFKKQFLYPYHDNLYDNISFKLNILDTNFLNNKNSFKLNIETKNSKAKNSKNLFKLQELYQEHKDIVLELIQKSVMYNESYIEELMKNYEGTLFKNEEDLLRLIFGGYISNEELGKRPLSKLTKDILEQLEII